MYSDSDLDNAVAAGAISRDAAERLRAYVAQTRAGPAVDEEHFRLLTGFNDIFVSIAAVLMLAATGWLAEHVAGGFGGAAVAAASWGLAEYFTRRRRMALPSILLLAGFIGGVGYQAGGATGLWQVLLPGNHWGQQPVVAERLVITGAAMVIAASLHWRRFMVPITVAAGVLTLVTLANASLLAFHPELLLREPLIMLAGGFFTFALAMWWDMSDPARHTRRSDVAFWLHLAAAPMMVHPAFSLLGLLSHGEADTGRAAAALGIYLLLGLVALSIDRRALLVSALAYVLTAMTALLKSAGGATLSFALTALVIGSALLLLSALWHPARRGFLTILPTAFRRRLPAA